MLTDPVTDRRRALAQQWLKTVAEDDYVTFKISASGSRVLVARVLQVRRFSSFAQMLLHHGIENVLPGEKLDLVDAVGVYHTFANRRGTSYKELEHTCGVVALTLKPL